MGTLEKAIDESQQVEYKARLERLDQAQKLVKKGELEAAFLLFRTNLTWSERALGASHDIAVIDQQSLAFILNQLGRYREASELNQKALWTLKYAEGESSPSQRQLNIRQNLASDYIGLGNRRLAVSIYRKNFEARRQHPQLGEDHVDTTKTGELLALSLYKIEDFVGACDLQRKVLAAMIRTKAQDIEILRSRQTFSLYLFRLGRFGAAKILLEKNIEALKSRVTDAALLASGERCLSRCSTKMEEQGTETTYAGQKNILQSPTSDTDADIPEDPKSQFLDIGNTMIPIRGVRAIASSQNELPGTGKRVVTNTPVSLRLQNANLQPPPDTPKVSTQNRGGQAGKCPASKEYAFNTKDGPSIVNIVPAGQKNLENPKFASAIPTINEPAADPTPRTKAKTPQPVLGQQDKAWSKPRPRSVSPGSGWSARKFVPFFNNE
jgi:tetratricopeptide (TPR) repeat protein